MTRPARIAAALGLALAATAALGHSGVQDPEVKARMDAMGTLGDEVAVLGAMAKGEAAFDPDLVEAVLSDIEAEAVRIPARFESAATDPKSEALPVIWDDFEDFTRRSEALAEVAAGVAAEVGGEITSRADLGPVMRALGSACRDCHEVYRE